MVEIGIAEYFSMAGALGIIRKNMIIEILVMLEIVKYLSFHFIQLHFF
jgi:hypothetical protein